MTNKHLIYNQFNLSLIIFLMLLSIQSISQEKKNDSRDVQEIKIIFRDATNKKFKLPFILGTNDSLTLPSYFTNYIKYYDIKTKFDKIHLPYFNQTNNFNINLNKVDCEILNSSMLNDTFKLYIQKSWFNGYNVNVLSDSITKSEKYFGKLMKPIFFRNYTRCFIAILNHSGMESFFLKKNNNHWIFDKSYIMIDYD
jgi:hypothetical protein